MATNSARLAWALSTSVQLEGLVKDLRGKNIDLAQWLEKASSYGDKVRAARAQAEGARKAKEAVEARTATVEATSVRLKKELHETECQVAVLMRLIDHANEHYHLVVEALDASNKEKREPRQRTDAQVEEIESLKAKAKTVGESEV